MHTNSWGGYSENDYRSYLEHHGILGMRWGVRRYQNKDGSLTSRGKQHYSMSDRGQELQLRIAEKSDLLDSARTEKEAKRIQRSIDKDFKELNELSRKESRANLKAEKKEEKRLNNALYLETNKLAGAGFRRQNYEKDAIRKGQKFDDAVRKYLEDDRHPERNYRRVEKAKAKYEKAVKQFESVKIEYDNASKAYKDKLSKTLDFDKYDVSMIPMDHIVGDWSVRVDTPQVRRKLR